MKLSIWQQFSSNHSGTYVVVGEFETIEAAQHATSILKQSVKAIKGANSEANRDLKQFTDVENNIIQTFQLNWSESIDWLRGYLRAPNSPYDAPEDHIQVFENLVFVDANDYFQRTWQAGHQFESFLHQLGGTTGVNARWSMGGQIDKLAFNIKCLAPDNNVTITIRAQTKDHLKQDGVHSKRRLTPWVEFHTTDNANEVRFTSGLVKVDDSWVYLENLKSDYMHFALIAYVHWLRSLGCVCEYQLTKLSI